MRAEARRTRALIAAVLALSLAGAAAAHAAHIDYLYVDGNEGQASGGHTAIAFEGQTFHFQFREGWILPVRDASGAFERTYRVLENRNIRVHRVEVPDATFETLRDGFNARYFESEVLLAERRRLRERQAAAASNSGRVSLPAAGYFWAESELSAASVAGRAESAHSLADRLSRQARAQRLALRAGTFFAVPGASAMLDDAAMRTLEAFRVRIRQSLARLETSTRPDVGEVRFVLLAREAVVAHSLAQRRLHMLDAWPDDARQLSVVEIRRRGGQLDEMEVTTAAALARVLGVLDGRTDLDETEWSRIEDAANRAEEVRRSARAGHPMRLSADRLHPQLGAAIPLADTHAATAVAANDEVEARLAAIEAKLDSESAYNLVARNCVSEIFATIDEVLLADRNGGASDAMEVSREHLGGHVRVPGSLAFVPFVSADAVASEYRVVETSEWPSHRRARLAEIHAREGDGVLVALREMNTLTSTIYRRNGDDSIFLFFTDEDPALRPLLGAANLLTGLGAAVVGLPMAPFDGGDLLAAGLRGAFWSVPELGFASVRKGSFFFVSDAAEVGSQASLP